MSWSSFLVIPVKTGIQGSRWKPGPRLWDGSRLSSGRSLDTPVSEYGADSSSPVWRNNWIYGQTLNTPYPLSRFFGPRLFPCFSPVVSDTIGLGSTRIFASTLILAFGFPSNYPDSLFKLGTNNPKVVSSNKPLNRLKPFGSWHELGGGIIKILEPLTISRKIESSNCKRVDNRIKMV